MYLIHFYKTRRGNYPVKDFIQQLSKKSRAKIWRYVELLEKHGPNLLRPYADSVEGKIRELRIRVIEGNIRILYFFFTGGNAVLLHALKKKLNRQCSTCKILSYDVTEEILNYRRFTMGSKLLKFQDVLQQELKDKDFRKHYEEEGRKLEVGYKVAQLRHKIGMTQEQLARRTATSQTVISRLESGNYWRCSLSTLEKIAMATGTHLTVGFKK